MKKLIIFAALALTSATHANEDSEYGVIKLNFGEVRVINSPTTVTCQASPAEKVCTLTNERYTAYGITTYFALSATGYVRDDLMNGNGSRVSTKSISLGRFASKAEALARMKELQQSGFCL